MKRIVKNPDVRRSEILRAAAKLFFKKGFEKTALQDVMDDLGIAKGTIYHYFDSKEDLLEAVVNDMVDARLNEIERVLKEIEGNALEKIEKLVELSNMAKEHPALVDQLHPPAHAGMHTRILVETLMKFSPIYERLIQEGCSEGIFTTDSPRECAEMVLCAVQFLTDTGIYPWSNADLMRRNRAFPGLIEQLLQAPKGAFRFLQGG